MPGPDLRDDWRDLLRRRPEFSATLAPYGDLVEGWASWEAMPTVVLEWGARECRERWERGMPLIADAPPPLTSDRIEDLLGLAIGHLEGLGELVRDGLRRFEEAWDRGAIGPTLLYPTPGRIGSGQVQETTGLPAEVVAFLAAASLRPPFEAYFARCRANLDDFVWALGICPFCGAPPGFSDVGEDGRRRLACHCCGGSWDFSRMRCPFCGNERSRDLVRLEPEGRDQGYVVIACDVCRLYVKELDRRVRWNGRCSIVEDWGSPHFDLVAVRAGYSRPLPALVQLAAKR